jgi:photosystem II stability/assembly factor-like uncharacterized protein
MLRLRQIFVLLEIHLTLGKRYLWHSGQIASHLSGVDKSHHVQPLEVVDVEDLQQPDRRTVLQTAAAASAGAAVASTPLAASAKAQRQWEPIDLSYLFDNLTSNAPIAGLPGASAKPILFDIEFDTKDPNHGFIIGNKGTFLETFDGGKKWKFRKFRQLDEDDEINYRFLQVSFKDGEGFIIGKPPILLYTQDEAKSWVRVPLSPKLPGDPTTIVCLGKGKAEMATSSGAVYSTENAGLNWKAEVKETIDATLNRVSSSGVQGASYFAGSIASIQRDTEGSYLAISSRGNFYLTYKPGEEFWIPHNRDSSRRITAMGFVRDKLTDGLWMSAAGGEVSKTQEVVDMQALSIPFERAKLNTGGYGILDVNYRPDGKTAWAVGGGGIIFKSTDGGIKWDKDKSADDLPSNLYKIKFFGDRGFILGSNGLILKLVDA